MTAAVFFFFFSGGAEKKIARVGDLISHGGAILAGSPNSDANVLAIARLGDPVNCALHGRQTIISASTTVKANKIGCARFGDLISCGATISSGSANVVAGA